MTRRCSHCNSNGHNTRTCPTRSIAGGGGLRLFGVRLTDGSFIKKSASMGNLSHYSAIADSTEEYHSDDPDRCSDYRRRHTRKKGTPWTEEEHRKFLLGLQNLGKGDWRGISKVYVPSRTPSQVASHAQKYFIHQNSVNRKKKRSSLFDLVPNTEASSSIMPARSTDNEKLMTPPHQETPNINSVNSLPSLDLSLKSAIMPLQFQLMPQDACSLKVDPNSGTGTTLSHRQNLNPDELVSISHLTLQETPALSLGLPGNR